MRDLILATMLLTSLLLVGCGNDQEVEGSAKASRDTGQASAAQDSTPTLADQNLTDDGHVRSHASAGFSIYWPGGCGQLLESSSEGATDNAAKEQIYTCEHSTGIGFSVRHYHRAQTRDGLPASPVFVVDLVEHQMKRYGVRPDRQRPLEGGAIQGVEVHGVDPAGSGEVWIRGLLVGTEVYILKAWSNQGGLFENVEAADFFHSFQLLP